jgi:hypothetical protein
MVVLQVLLELEVMERVKNQVCFFMTLGMNMQWYLPAESKPFSLSIGAGLHYYMGLSRMTMSSTLNYLTIDAPIFNWPLIENSDQFARQIGIFAKGKYNKWEYRFSINKPFATNQTPVNVTDADIARAVDNNNNAMVKSRICRISVF